MPRKTTPKLRRTTPFLAPPLWSQLPLPDAVSARDGLRLQKTEDVLFLAQLLVRAKGFGLIRETRDADGRWCYSPYEGNAADGLPGFVKPAGIRRKLKQGFWGLRKIIAKREIRGTSLTINGRKIRDAKRWAFGQPWKLGASLIRPFSKEADAFLDSLHELLLMNDPSLNELAPSASVKDGSIICPMDGIVTPLVGTLCTSPESWEALCGREWKVMICPDCLGEFQVQLNEMN